MSTLPRLNPGIRMFQHGIGKPAGQQPMFSPPRSQSQFSPTVPAPSSTNTQNTITTSSQNNQIRSIRQVAQKKYEAYVSEIRQIERNLLLLTRKADQESRRAQSRFIDSVSSIYSEVSTLHNQQQMISKKLQGVERALKQTTTIGLKNTLRPLNDGFTSFGQEFDKAMQNVESLFSNLSNRSNTICSDFQKFETTSKDINQIGIKYKEMTQAHNELLQKYESDRTELEDLVRQQRDSTLAKLNNRMKELNLKIDTLEKESITALNQSQDVIAESQNAQYEFRQLFTDTMEKGMNRFKDHLNEVKTAITELNQARFSHLDDVHKRLATATESISKIKGKRMKQMLSEEKKARHSMQPELDKMKQRIEQLEKELQEKKGLAPKKKTRPKKQPGKKSKLPNLLNMFYNVQKDGTIKCIFLLQDGTQVL